MHWSVVVMVMVLVGVTTGNYFVFTNTRQRQQRRRTLGHMSDRVLSCLPTVHMASRESARAEEKPGEVETEAEVETKCPQCHHRPSTILGTLQVSDLYHDGLYGPFRGRIRAAVCPGAW